MGFLDKILGKADKPAETKRDFWQYIESSADLNAAIEKSSEQKVAIFKHSTRCFISKTVLKNFEKEVSNSSKPVSYYFLDLLAHRDLSNAIAEKFGITHQSPQLIVIENGKAIADASHQSISVDLI